MAQGGKRAGAGRPKGSKNKVTPPIREAFTGHFSESVPKIIKALESLESEPEKYLAAWAKFLPYFAPRLQSIGISEAPEGVQIIPVSAIANAVNHDKSI